MALSRAQIQVAFQNSLGRAASASDENSYFSVSQSGALSDAQIFSTISNSREADQIADPVIRFYQAAFGRVPDQAGLQNAENFVRALGPSAATYQNLSNMFAQSTEFTNRFGTGTAVDAAYVQALYSTILGRQASSGEVDGYVNSAGATRGGVLYLVSQSQEAISISDAAVNGFQQNAAQGQAVYTGTLYTPANGSPGGSQAGTSFTLTTGVDAPVATAGNDTFIAVVDAQTAANSTLTASDRVNGLGGTGDVLNITKQGTSAVLDITGGAQVSNVEIVNLRAVGTGAATLDANNTVGLTAFNNNGSTVAVNVSNLADPAIVTVSGNGVATNGDTTAAYVAGATSGDLVLSNGVNGGAIALNGTGLTSVAIVSNGATNTVGALSTNATPASVTINASSALNTTGLSVANLAAGGQSLTISGSASNQAATTTAVATAAVVLGTLDTDFATVNASGLSAGGISATLASLTATVTGGTGNDIITTGGVLTTGSVNAGAGTGDRLIVAATADLASATLGAKYTNFEQLQLQNGVAVDATNIAGISSILLNDGNGATAITGLNATQAGAITVLAGDGAATIGITNAANVGQIDTVKLLFDNGNTTLNENINATASTFTLTGVENLEVTAVDQVSITQSATASGALQSVTLLGAGNHTFVTGNIATANFSLNAGGSSGTNVLDASSFATNGVAITGGTGVDTITGSGQADIINSGTGNDVVTGGAGIDTINLGTGDDTVISTGTFAAGNANHDVITGFTFGTASADKYDLAFGVAHGTTTIAGGVGATTTLAAVAPVAVADNGTASANDVIYTFSGANDKLAANTTGANAVANAVTALTSGGDFAATNVASGDSLVLVMDNGTDAFVFHYVADATAATTTAADLELVGIVKAQLANQVAVGDFI